MLVLRRREDESIIIDDHIRITVMAIQTDQIRLKVEAPLGTSGDLKTIQKGQTLRLGDDIEIVLDRVLTSHCILGITAPPDRNIVREELIPIDQN